MKRFANQDVASCSLFFIPYGCLALGSVFGVLSTSSVTWFFRMMMAALVWHMVLFYLRCRSEET